jgi:holliday junction DNA helicase RuvB
MIEKDDLQAERLIAPIAKPNEEVHDRAIRPKTLGDYIGQPQVRANGNFYPSRKKSQ